MYNHLDFAEERNNSTVHLQKMIQLSQDQYSYHSQMVKLNKVGITDRGLVTFMGEERQMIKPAFVSLCKQLRIPDPFAKFIPWELLKHNIDTLTQEIEKEVQLFVRDDGVIINIASETFIPVPHKVLLEALKEGVPHVKRGHISDTGLEWDTIHPVFNGDETYADIEVREGDVVETGLTFNNSTNGYSFTTAKLFLWRLVCTNGMTLPTKIGHAKLRVKSGREVSVSINNFVHQVRRMYLDQELVESQLRGLNRLLISNEFSQYWKGLRKVVRDDEYVDQEIFQVDKEQRQLYLAQDRAAKKDSEIELKETVVNGYDLMNNVTLKAKEFEPQVRRKMEAYGGKILMGFPELEA